MRLRRETGDFSIDLTSGSAAIPANLSAEDLIGAIVVNGSMIAVIDQIETHGSELLFTVCSQDYAYTIATGEVVENAGD